MQFHYLAKILDSAHEKKMPVYLILPPKRSDFNHMYFSDAQNEHLYFMEQLKAVNSHNYPLLGGFDQCDSAADSLFADGVHLNGPGQQEFSHFVSTEIQNIENSH